MPQAGKQARRVFGAPTVRELLGVLRGSLAPLQRAQERATIQAAVLVRKERKHDVNLRAGGTGHCHAEQTSPT
jgi:hypothetical protein